jgi:sporulation protein YlmC with PRC-barrel domain
VLSSDGLAIGEITKLFMGPDWRISALEVKVRRNAEEQVGVQHSMFHSATIEIATDLVQSIGDAVLLSVPSGSLRQPTEEPPAAGAPAH